MGANKQAGLSRPAAELAEADSPAVSTSASTYAAAAQSRATKRSYDADLNHFKSHGGTIPATPEMIADYLAECAGTTAVATLQHRLIAIHRAHTDDQLTSPGDGSVGEAHHARHPTYLWYRAAPS